MPLSCSNFNTSHVSINHWIVEVTVLKFLISIHPMFLLIFTYGKKQNKHNAISIHPMFLLIQGQAPLNWRQVYFNTSHVSINRMPASSGVINSKISIHPMFLLISCTIGIFRNTSNFNTSHVSINLVWLFYF